MQRSALATTALILLAAGCTDALPSDIEGYRDRCIKLNPQPIPPTDADPHKGFKDVFACNVSLEQLVEPDGRPKLPYPDGTLIVKDSRRAHQDFQWLVATAKKEEGSWSWAEYTRNFENEDFLGVLAPEKVCVDCHRKAEESDWIFTTYAR